MHYGRSTPTAAPRGGLLPPTSRGRSRSPPRGGAPILTRARGGDGASANHGFASRGGAVGATAGRRNSRSPRRLGGAGGGFNEPGGYTSGRRASRSPPLMRGGGVGSRRSPPRGGGERPAPSMSGRGGGGGGSSLRGRSGDRDGGGRVSALVERDRPRDYQPVERGGRGGDGRAGRREGGRNA